MGSLKYQEYFLNTCSHKYMWYDSSHNLFYMCDNFYININMFYSSTFYLNYVFCYWIWFKITKTMFRHFFSLIFIGYHIGYHTNHEWIILKFLSLIGINSIRIGLTMHDPSINERYFVLSVTLATHIKDSLKLNNTKNTCLISRNIILYYYLSLNTCECLIFQIYW